MNLSSAPGSLFLSGCLGAERGAGAVFLREGAGSSGGGDAQSPAAAAPARARFPHRGQALTPGLVSSSQPHTQGCPQFTGCSLPHRRGPRAEQRGCLDGYQGPDWVLRLSDRVREPYGRVPGPYDRVLGPRGWLPRPFRWVPRPNGRVQGPYNWVPGPLGFALGPYNRVPGPNIRVPGPFRFAPEPSNRIPRPHNRAP